MNVVTFVWFKLVFWSNRYSIQMDLWYFHDLWGERMLYSFSLWPLCSIMCLFCVYVMVQITIIIFMLLNYLVNLFLVFFGKLLDVGKTSLFSSSRSSHKEYLQNYYLCVCSFKDCWFFACKLLFTRSTLIQATYCWSSRKEICILVWSIKRWADTSPHFVDSWEHIEFHPFRKGIAHMLLVYSLRSTCPQVSYKSIWS